MEISDIRCQISDFRYLTSDILMITWMDAGFGNRLYGCTTMQAEEIKLHGRLVRLGSSARTPYTCRLSTWSSPTALQGPYGPGVLILGRASRLDAFSGYPYPTSLTGDATGVTAGTRAVSPTRSSRTRVGLPQHSNAHHGYRPNCLTTF